MDDFEVNAYLIAERHKDTWKFCCHTFDTYDEAKETANNWAKCGDTMLIIPCQKIKGTSPGRAQFKVVEI